MRASAINKRICKVLPGLREPPQAIRGPLKQPRGGPLDITDDEIFAELNRLSGHRRGPPSRSEGWFLGTEISVKWGRSPSRSRAILNELVNTGALVRFPGPPHPEGRYFRFKDWEPASNKRAPSGKTRRGPKETTKKRGVSRR